jgi:hypothetical protein
MEAEVAGICVNVKEGVNVRNIINIIGHPQPITPLLTSNLTTFGIMYVKMKQQRSKAIELRFYWLKDREAQNKCIMFWDLVKLNRGYYFTNHHAKINHP